MYYLLRVLFLLFIYEYVPSKLFPFPFKGNCLEDSYADQKGTTSPTVVTENTVDDCRQSCVLASCQAFSYVSSSKLCSQYINVNPFYFDDPSHRVTAATGTTFYVRHCYSRKYLRSSMCTILSIYANFNGLFLVANSSEMNMCINFELRKN